MLCILTKACTCRRVKYDSDIISMVCYSAGRCITRRVLYASCMIVTEFIYLRARLIFKGNHHGGLRQVRVEHKDGGSHIT